MEKYLTISEAKKELGLVGINNNNIKIEVFQDTSSDDRVDFYMHNENESDEVTLETYEKTENEKVSKRIKQLEKLGYLIRLNTINNY